MLSLDFADFNIIFPQYSPFKIENFDELFTDNSFFDKDEFFENLKITASYYIWSTYYYSWKVDRAEKSSTFDNLNRLPKLFGMCVVIESLANELLGRKKLLLDRANLLYTFIGGIKDYKKVLYPKVKDKDDVIHVLLKELLNYKSKTFTGTSIDEIDRCILIYSLIRNFSAHNIKSIEFIGENFFNITQSILFLMIVFLIELKKKGKIG
jgi:hypothetical protein